MNYYATLFLYTVCLKELHLQSLQGAIFNNVFINLMIRFRLSFGDKN